LLLTIEKLVYGGDGLARLPADEHGRGKAVFLPFVLAEEKVEASLLEQRPGFARAQADEIVEASSHRVPPPCRYFGECGGCHYQHASYEHQLEIKAAILTENLRRIAKLELAPELVVHPSPPWNYRNRSRLKVQTNPGFALGYYKLNTHDLLPVTECPISSPLINQAITALWQLGGTMDSEIQEIEFFANAEDTQLLLEVDCAPGTAEEAAMRAAEQLQKVVPCAAGVTVRRVSGKNRAFSEMPPIATLGATELTYRTRHSSYRVSAGAFFQVNRHLADKLIDLVAGGISGELALDLYAGVGLFSTVLFRSFAQVIAVESSPTSHADLLYNSPSTVKAVRSTTEQYLRTVAGRLRPDVVVTDPPRGGLGESVVRSLIGLGAARIIYVSCDPATLSRDLVGLLQAGYSIQQAHVVDLFPQTYHVESVFHLVR
jgi:23S rRNA (uracil1939-C5)-methyltransferase